MEDDDVPAGYARLGFAVTMEERIGVMKEFGAEFVEDLSQVRELHEPWTPEANLRYTMDDYNLHRTYTSTSGNSLEVDPAEYRVYV